MGWGLTEANLKKGETETVKTYIQAKSGRVQELVWGWPGSLVVRLDSRTETICCLEDNNPFWQGIPLDYGIGEVAEFEEVGPWAIASVTEQVTVSRGML
jgi:hypothetical protein